MANAARVAAVPPMVGPHGQSAPTRLGWGFTPLAFDSLGSPADETVKVIEEFSDKIASQSAVSTDCIRMKIYQKISYAIWSTCANAILGRAPQHSQNVAPTQV